MSPGSALPPGAIPDGDEMLGRCERILEMAAVRKADQAECYWEWDADLGLEIENGRVASTGGSRSQGGSVRLVVGGKPGFAYLTQESDAAAAIDRALRNARAMPAKGYSLPAGKRLGAARSTWDEEIASLDATLATRWADELLAGAIQACPDGTVSGGGVGQSAGVHALASSEGVALHDRWTLASAGASIVLDEGGGRSVSASESAETATVRLDARSVGQRAGEVTQSLRKPKPAAAGKRPLVLEPEVASELIASLAVSAAMGDDAMRGKTLWSGKLGAAVSAPVISLHDDPASPTGIAGAAADGEGLATRRIPILEGGLLRTYLFDSWDGHRNGQPSSHSAVRGGFKGRPSTGTHKRVLAGPNPRAPDSLVAEVDDGYLVDSVLGAHTANATTGEFSVTAPNVWRIRKGAIEGACTEIAIGGNLEQVLRNVRSVSGPAKWGDGWVMPRVLVDGLQVSV